MTIDTTTNFSALKLSWAARNSCKQRAGRTGRVMNGRCYRFVEKPFYYVRQFEYFLDRFKNENNQILIEMICFYRIECIARRCNTGISK